MVPGLGGKAEMVVKKEDLVRSLGSVDVDVLSTPRLVHLLESAAIEAICEFIPADHWSLGVTVNIKHLSPTPLGMKVTAHALLKEIHKNRLHFIVDAYDEKGKVAEGEHDRVLVLKKEFLEKVEKKRSGEWRRDE